MVKAAIAEPVSYSGSRSPDVARPESGGGWRSSRVPVVVRLSGRWSRVIRSLEGALGVIAEGLIIDFVRRRIKMTELLPLM